MNNLIYAIQNLILLDDFGVKTFNNNRNRVNSIGDALEVFIKDLFADSLNCNEKDRIKKISKTFSYLGNNSNPPDAMLKGGDAIEIKKIESDNSALALNSSYPKHTLKSDSPMISKACKDAEKWKEKDIIYVVGVVKNNVLTSLAFVYGIDYCATEECYLKIKNTIKNGVEQIQGIEFTETKELGHINKVDPLEITYMRVRGMWGIENPWKVFDYVYKRDMTKDFNFMCIINDKKWKEFNNTDELIKLSKKVENFKIDDVKIKNPDNPAKLVSAKLITYWR